MTDIWFSGVSFILLFFILNINKNELNKFSEFLHVNTGTLAFTNGLNLGLTFSTSFTCSHYY